MEEAERFYIIKGLKENRAIEIQLQSCSDIEELKEKMKILDIQEKSNLGMKLYTQSIQRQKYLTIRINLPIDNSMEDGIGEMINFDTRFKIQCILLSASVILSTSPVLFSSAVNHVSEKLTILAATTSGFATE
ncbi:hypothetical protein TNCV_3087451 [Trichonephila clavipes]|uniref:Uncharacterized protein n=1 Tax=Trichonephila clavipes TaxID=2585209 RepID=A0A8X6UVN7_TRICX|nr:hypothetical protein TNCV_3087451 [Trichonephila clavipes]